MGARLVGGAVALGLLWWAGHGTSSTNSSPSASSYVSDDDEEADSGSDLTDSEADTSGIKGSETYDEFDTRRDELGGSAGTYQSYGCTQDCSGHDAGYQWAEEHGVTDESDCGGKSWSFEEGCVAYAQEQSEDEDESDSSDSDDEGDGS